MLHAASRTALGYHPGLPLAKALGLENVPALVVASSFSLFLPFSVILYYSFIILGRKPSLSKKKKNKNKNKKTLPLTSHSHHAQFSLLSSPFRPPVIFDFQSF